MIIESQDKTYLTNFANVTCVTLGVDEEEKEYAVLVTTIDDDEIILGTYTTEERAKEVLQEIIETYKTTERYKVEDAITRIELAIKGILVYEMPEE